MINILIGILFQAIVGLLGPVFGYLIIKCIFAMTMYSADADNLNTLAVAGGFEPFFIGLEEF